MTMEFVGEPGVARGVVERRIVVHQDGRRVPGLLFSPEGERDGRPTVLLGHGASLHKRVGYILSMARRFVRHHGFCAVAIDGPCHGERREDGGQDAAQVFSEFGEIWSTEGFIDDMVADWRATLDAVASLPEVDEHRVGYWGVSMGTILGLPLVVAEPRIRAAVFGLMGTVGPTAKRLAEDAPKLQVPVMMLQQWHDELIPRDRLHTLFDLIGSPVRSLHAYPGKHAELPAGVYAETEAFLAEHLSAE